MKAISLGAKYFFEDLLHALVTKSFLHLKGAISRIKSENQCWTC